MARDPEISSLSSVDQEQQFRLRPHFSEAFDNPVPPENRIMEWFGLERTLKAHPTPALPWTGTLSTLPDCSKPHPAYLGHYQGWNSHISPPSSKNILLVSHPNQTSPSLKLGVMSRVESHEILGQGRIWESPLASILSTSPPSPPGEPKQKQNQDLFRQQRILLETGVQEGDTPEEIPAPRSPQHPVNHSITKVLKFSRQGTLSLLFPWPNPSFSINQPRLFQHGSRREVDLFRSNTGSFQIHTNCSPKLLNS